MVIPFQLFSKKWILYLKNGTFPKKVYPQTESHSFQQLCPRTKTSVDRVSRFKQIFHGVDPEISSYDLHFRRHYYFAFLLCPSESLKIPKHVLLGSFPIFCIPGISCMYFFDIAVLRYSGDKKFDYLFFDKKRFENRYNVTAISAR